MAMPLDLELNKAFSRGSVEPGSCWDLAISGWRTQRDTGWSNLA